MKKVDYVDPNHNDLRVPVQPEDRVLAIAYANKMLTPQKKALYAARGQHNPEVIHGQYYYSQLGELAVASAFGGWNCTPPTGFVPGKSDYKPDHECFPGGQKKFLHTKTQTFKSSLGNGTAWLVGYGPGKDTHFYQFPADDYVVLCSIAEDESAVLLRAVLALTTIRDCALLTEKGVAPYLLHSKRSIRLSMIDEMGIPRFDPVLFPKVEM